MRIIVVSDSHNSLSALYCVIKAEPKAELFLHLGDGEPEFESLCMGCPDKRMMFVKGNSDWGSSSKEEDILKCQSKRIFFTHGHRYDVKQGLDALYRRAKSLSADIALFGHTHVAMNIYYGGMHMLNPGSIALPRDGAPSYGVIDLAEAQKPSLRIVRL